ncbi:peptide chain release factor N(5)-glutamine methyltransferase [bacterium]|nr:peptide chain release factor N(5)-glutamine methyltransferase [bacterium]
MFRNKLINDYITAGFERETAISELDFVCDVVFNLTPVDILLNKNIPENFEEELKKIITKRITTKRPVQQIVGRAYFMNKVYKVSEDVLIPRPETELLVLKAEEIIKKHKVKNFLDIGTGTGCIAISLLELCPDLKAQAVDISGKALEIARQNSDEHRVSERLTLKKSDLFSEAEGKFDLIISNPPYIPIKDKPSLQSEVRDFEPETALFTNDEEGIEVYKKIIAQAPNYLNNGGYLMFEIGYNQSELLRELFEVQKNYSDFELIKDLSENDRVVFARLG